MNVVKFSPVHLSTLRLQGAQAWASPLISSPGYAETLTADGSRAWSAIHEGEVIACAGIAKAHAQMGIAWALISPDAGRHMVGIDRATRSILSSCGLRRVEADADPDFGPGRRWLEMLGFQYEGRKRCCTPTGRDMLLFSRIQ
jgi:RimJ/RimL family protein N-acetyltransferase